MCMLSQLKLGIYILQMCKITCYLFSMYCEILLASLMNIWLLILAHKRWKFYFFTYVNWGTDFPLLNMEYSIFHIGKLEWCLSYRKYVTVYISHMNIWVQIFLHEVWNLYFMFENLAACFVMTYGILHVSHMDKCAHIFLYEERIL